MKHNIIIRLAKKEFFGYINSPLAYTVIVPFLLLSIFIYTRTALVGGEASLRPYFELLPWFLLLLAPALSMKLLTDEYKSETLEVLFAHPISELEIVLGKFFGALAFFIVILLTTIGLPLTLITYSRPDIGQIAGQYIGAFLIGGTFLSIGIAASAYVKNAISSFLLGAAISFVLIIIGLDFVTQMLPFPFSRIAAELSVLTHGENIARGLLDIRDVFYFITITGLLLAAAIAKLSERKTLEDPTEKRKLHLALGLIASIGIVSNVLLSFYPIRLDLTQSRLFTLSQGTKQTIKNLPDIVTITIYQSRELPAQMQLVARDITDLLKDYEKLSRNIKARVIYPEDSETAMEAQSAGIREVQFNSVGSGKFEVQAGVLGIAVRYGDKTESIPFVSDSSDLEYQLTRRIRKLTNDQGQVVGVLRTGFSQNQILDELLATQYETQTISSDETEDNLEDLKALIVVDDGSLESTASATIKNFLDLDGSVLYLGSGVTVDQRSLSAQKSQSTNDLFLKDFGVSLNNDLVYDLQLSETLAFGGQGGQRYLSQYPYWLRALPATDSFSPLSTVKSISLGWPSSITLNEKEGITQKKLLVTGLNAGRTEGSFNISPQVVTTLKPNAKEVLLAALAEKDNARLVVIGSSTMADDQFLGNNRDNVAFLSNTIDYLATDKDLAIIPSKSAGRAVFEFKSPTDILFVQYGNLLIPPVVVIAFAIYRLRRRKTRAQRVYVK